jgi:hypothetical protein
MVHATPSRLINPIPLSAWLDIQETSWSGPWISHRRHAWWRLEERPSILWTVQRAPPDVVVNKVRSRESQRFGRPLFETRSPTLRGPSPRDIMARDIRDIMERAVRIAGMLLRPRSAKGHSPELALAAPRVSRRPDPIQHPES